MKSFENSLKKNGPKIKTVDPVEITRLHCTLYIAGPGWGEDTFHAH